MQVGTNLIQFEMIALGEARFILCEACKCVFRTLFVNENTTHCKWHAYPEAWPKTRNNKPIWQARIFKFSTQQTNRWAVGWTLEATILPPTEVPPPRYGQIYIINFGPPPNTKQYEVTIQNFFNCICVDFIQMMVGSLVGGSGCIANISISSCKMWCIMTKYPTWSWNEVQCIMCCARVIILE